MDNCPYCGAPGSFQEAVDGCCYVCGMVLPDSSVEPAAADAPTEMASATMATSGPSALPPAIPPSAAEDEIEPPAINLIQPRNLGPEYARRVTAAWQATKSPFRNPRETLNSSSITGGDPSGLLIAARSVRSVDEQRRADYELTEVIGEGNMGTVWSARQASLNREVAVKIPKHSAGGSTLGREQFISEVVVTGQLDHPNIVPIYDLARDESGQLFYSMKRVEGQSWDQCMHEPGRTRLDNIEILMKVCDAIRFAHDRGVIHRDIKPQNIMVGKYGEVAVMDWGIALRLEADARMSSITRLSPAGTPAYMAPEMATANAGDIGPHTDVYLLGAVLYEIITREPPHPPPKDSHERLVQQNACLLIAARNLISPAQETGELVDIAYKAMATDISNRYQTVAEFQEAIRDYYSHSESIALADRGDAHLTNAVEMRNGVYEDYARARFAFGEALELWPDNSRARGGLDEATLRYAETAYRRGDFALGLSLLDRGNPDHADLLKKLTVAQHKSQRNRFVALASAAAAACFLVLGVLVSLYFAGREYSARKDEEQANIALKRANSDLDKTNDDLKEKSDALQTANGKLNDQKVELASNNTQLTELNSELNSANTQLADSNTALTSQIQQTNAAKNQAEVASYRSEVGLAAEEIQRNAFDGARDILDKQRNLDEERNNTTQPPLRNWEWGHLMYLANAPAVVQFDTKGMARVEAVALSPDQKWIAAGTDNGQVQLWWRPDPNKPALQLPTPTKDHSPRITALAISADNRLLAIAAGKEVHFWGLPAGDPSQGIKPVGMPLSYKHQILSVAFSPNADTVLTSADDAKAQLWTRTQPQQPPLVFAGHLPGQVWQARFSPDGQRIVTSGQDGSVRLWDAKSGAEQHKFEGHREPVYTAEFSPDGIYIVSGGRDRRLLVWKVPPPDASRSRQNYIESIARRLQGDVESIQTNGFVQLGEHGAAVRSVSFSPTGNVLFSASEDNSIRVWDVGEGLVSGRLSKTLRGHGGWVRSCAAASDGQHVLSGSYDGRIYLWDWPNYAFPRVLRPETERSLSDVRFTSSAASPDANWIATASENGVVTIWNMHDPLNPVPQMLTEGHDWQATTGVYFNGGSRLLTAGGDNATLVWDTRLGNEVLRIGGWKVAGGTGWRGVAAASGNGRWIATGSDDEAVLAKIWDAQSGQLIASLSRDGSDERAENERPEATAIAFAPGDQTLFVGDQRGNCYLFDTSSGTLRSSFLGHDGKVSVAKFLPDGRLLTAGSDRTVARWNLQGELSNPQPEVLLTHRDRVVAMDISSDGKLVITASDSKDDEAVLRLWDAEGRELHHLTLEDLNRNLAGAGTAESQKLTLSIRSVALHPSQPRALVTVFDAGSSTYQVGNWQWGSQNSFGLISTRLRDTSMAIYAQDREGAVLTVGGRGAQLRLANEVKLNYRPQKGVLSVSFSPDSRLLASAGSDGSIKMWRYDVAAGKWMPDQKLSDGHPDAVNSVAFHPLDNNVLLSAGNDGRARIWNRGADGWSVTKTLGAENGIHGPIHQAIFSPPDGNQAADIITAGADADRGRVRIWNLAGELVRERSYDGPVQCVAVSPDRKWIVSGVDSEAWVWNREMPQDVPALMLPGHSAEITSLAFSPDGLRLFTASRDFNVKLWDTRPWDLTDANRQSSRELLNLEGHTDAVMSISYFANPTYPSLLTAGADGQAILWPTVKWQE